MVDCKLTKNGGGGLRQGNHLHFRLSALTRNKPRLIPKGINLRRKRLPDQRRTMVLMKSDEMNGGPTCSLSPESHRRLAKLLLKKSYRLKPRPSLVAPVEEESSTPSSSL